MNRLFFILPIVFFLAISCTNDDIEDLNNEVSTLQDSIDVIIQKHNDLLDSMSVLIAEQNSGSDIKAIKMAQIASLFESIARQPEASDVLISSTEILYSDYTELLPISDKNINERGESRGYSFGLMFEAVVRQPDAFQSIDEAAEKFLGEYNADYISDNLLDVTRAYSLPFINSSIARNPEADSLLNIMSEKYLDFDILKE